MTCYDDIVKLCRKAKDASGILASVDTLKKNRALKAMGRALIANRKRILAANKQDIVLARKKKISEAMTERLLVTESGIYSMAKSVFSIAALKDPVGSIIETRKRPNGLLIKKVKVPLGVILIIYESRPNVTSDCIALCLKSSNAVILRGGKEAKRSNTVIFDIMNREAMRSGLPAGSISLVKDTDRGLVDLLLRQVGLIDLVIPRGGESLIREVAEKSRIPVIKHYKGVCHTYVDSDADLEMAAEICFNAKVQRPGVCNAMETLLVHKNIASGFLPVMIERFKKAGVEIRGCQRTRRIIKDIAKATEEDWYAEYLGLVLSVKVVDNVKDAVFHIMKYGSHHSDAIVTGNRKNASYFLQRVDSACVYHNASTRFTDGGEFGKGAEMGISTDKIHARGPMGLEELLSYKYIVCGNGQVRI